MNTTMDSMFETTTGVAQRTETEGWRRWSPLVAALVVALTLAGVIGYHEGHAPVGGLTAQTHKLQRSLHTAQTAQTREVAALKHRIAVLAAKNRRCDEDRSVLVDIRRLLSQGKDDGAAEVASLALDDTRSRICAHTMLSLGSLWVTASTTTLYGSVPTGPLDWRPVATWQGIERQAAAYGASADPQLSPVTCLTMSFNAKLWTLSRFCFAEAVQQHLIGPYDALQLGKAYAATRNVGHDVAFHFAGQPRQKGLRLLATAAVLGRELHRDEAQADLIALLGPRRAAQVMPDRHDLVLRALRGAR